MRFGRRDLVAACTTAALACAVLGAPPARAAARRPITQRPARVAIIVGVGVPYRAQSPSQGAAAMPQEADPDHCVLYPSVVYRRKSSGYQNVGFKPYTKCSHAATSIRQVAQLYKYHDFGLAREPVGRAFTAGNTGEASLTQRNIGVRCTNAKSTKWLGITKGTTVEGGRTYESEVATRDATLDCGT